MCIEDKVRRRLAPFIVEGAIAQPQLAWLTEQSASALTVNVRLKTASADQANVELALRNAMHDLGADARLVINPA